MNHFHCRRVPGFTLSEVLISLALIGVLATILVPSLSKGMDQTTQFNAVKTVATELAQGYTHIKLSVSTDTTAQDLVNEINYVRIIDDDAFTTQVQTGAATFTETACTGSYRCALLQSGTLLLYNPDAVFTDDVLPLTENTSGLRFIVDPDGAGRKVGTEFILFYGGRVTTYPLFTAQTAITAEAPFASYTNTGGVTDELPDVTADPSYLDRWTQG